MCSPHLRTMDLFLISVSTDGHLSVWNDNDLVKPTVALDLKFVEKRDAQDKNRTEKKSDGEGLWQYRVCVRVCVCESLRVLGVYVLLRVSDRTDSDLCTVQTTCFAFPGRDTQNVILGSDEGYLYKAKLYDDAGMTARFASYGRLNQYIWNFHIYQIEDASRLNLRLCLLFI